MKRSEEKWNVRIAGLVDAVDAARLLDDFNTEFGSPSPGVDVLADRLRGLLGAETTFALLAGNPGVGIALVTLRRNIWYAGPVALLDELYVAPDLRGRGIGSALMAQLEWTCRAAGVELVEINVDEGDVGARRFYERHGFSSTDSDSSERALYYYRELPC